MDPDSIRVLHVDDDPDFGDLTATVLEREDERFVVETATTATEGLDSMWDRPPDCIVSDYDMPELDGIEFLERVREEYPEMPFILFTGKGSESVASQAISAGVTDYLEKKRRARTVHTARKPDQQCGHKSPHQRSADRSSKPASVAPNGAA